MKFRLTVQASLAGERLDKALALAPEIGSRNLAQNLIKSNKVAMIKTRRPSGLLASAQLKPSLQVYPGDEFEYEKPDLAPPPALKPWPFPLDICYEDEDLL